MTSKLTSLSLFFFVTSFCRVVNVYDFSVTTIEGASKSLSGYQGKKILIVTLPAEINDANDSTLYSLDSLGDANEQALVIIGVPSYEDGYTKARKDELRLWYRNFLDTGVVVTEGMYTRKTSGSQQASLFNWLTHHTENGHFDNDVTGPNTKFMIRGNGELYGVLEMHSKFGSSAMNRLLQAQ